MPFLKSLFGKPARRLSRASGGSVESSPGSSVADGRDSRSDAPLSNSRLPSKIYLPAPSPIKQTPSGLSILREPIDPVADIVFIHDLTGHRENSWTRNPGRRLECFWPQDLLPDELLNARIAVWGYETDLLRNGPFKSVSNASSLRHAQDLCSHLFKAGFGVRPIVFVAHGWGGVLLKMALLCSFESGKVSNTRLSHLSSLTRAIMFLGTPHSGVSGVDLSWGDMLAMLMGYRPAEYPDIARELEKESPRLSDLHTKFVDFLEASASVDRPIDIACFHAESPTPYMGTIVPWLSASMEDHESLPLPGDHTTMTKFGNDDSSGYVTVKNPLEAWMRVIDVEQTERRQQEDLRALRKKRFSHLYSGSGL